MHPPASAGNGAAATRPRVLMLAPFFYPCQVIGAHRAGKFAKFLPGMGYDVSVLTVDSRAAGWPTDERLARQIPASVEVVHTFYPFSDDVKQHIRGWLGRRAAAPAAGSGVGRPHSGSPFRPGQALLSWLTVPDKDILWAPGVLAALGRLRHRPDVIYATAPPHSTLVLGLVLKYLLGVPFVAGFRDPWTISETGHPWPTAAHRWLDRYMEESVLQRADQIIVNTPTVLAEYCRTYPQVPPAQYTMILNGFDEEDIAGIPLDHPTPQRVRIGYFGKIYVGRDPGPMFRAVRRLLDDGAIPPDSVEFVFYGEPVEFVRELAAQTGVSDIVRAHASIPYADALREMAACDVLLILSSPSTDKLHIPGKTYEYLALRRTVFALAGPGALGDLMRQYGFGLQVPPDEPERLRSTLRELIHELRAGRTERYVLRDGSAFSRRALTRQFAGVLDRARARGARRGAL